MQGAVYYYYYPLAHVIDLHSKLTSGRDDHNASTCTKACSNHWSHHDHTTTILGLKTGRNKELQSRYQESQSLPRSRLGCSQYLLKRRSSVITPPTLWSTSFPFSIRGIALAWMSVIVVKLHVVRASFRGSQI